MRNPNRVRSLHMAFAGNPKGFHAASGEGYRMVADVRVPRRSDPDSNPHGPRQRTRNYVTPDA